jgi:hypothetical protein
MLADREAVACHLSSNEDVHHYVAGPAGQMDKHIGDYRMYKNHGADKWTQWIGQLIKGNSKKGQIFNDAETVHYLEALRVY